MAFLWWRSKLDSQATPVDEDSPLPVQVLARSPGQPDPTKGVKSAPIVVSVGTTPTLILAANAKRLVAILANNNAAGGQALFVGKDFTLTSANGFPIQPGGALTDANSVDAWYGIVASTTADTRAIEFELP